MRWSFFNKKCLFFLSGQYRIHDKTSAVTFRVGLLEVRSYCCRLHCVNSLLFGGAWHMDFGKPLRKRNS